MAERRKRPDDPSPAAAGGAARAVPARVVLPRPANDNTPSAARRAIRIAAVLAFGAALALLVRAWLF